MRIFFVTNNYTPYSGGVVQSINATVDELRAQGYDVFIITLAFLKDHSDDPNYVIRLTSPIKFTYKQNYMALAWQPKKQLNDLFQHYQPNIIHIHHPFLLGDAALKIAQLYTIPCVFTHHTLYEEYVHYVPFPAIITKPIIRKIIKNFCNRVHEIIVPSSAVKNQLLSYGITTPISIIPSPIRKCFLTHSPIAKFSSPYFKLLLVTRFAKEKNIHFVFEVLNKLPSTFQLTLAGYGPEYENMQTLAFNTLNLPYNRVQFIHRPSQDDLLQLYRLADLFLFPSQTDTQGLVLAESLSQGLPVIALDGPGQRDSIINNYNGFIVNSAQEAADIIEHISQNQQLFNQLKEGALVTAHNYHPTVILKKLKKIYHCLLNH